jgi:hypothetical protein
VFENGPDEEADRRLAEALFRQEQAAVGAAPFFFLLHVYLLFYYYYYYFFFFLLRAFYIYIYCSVFLRLFKNVNFG